MQWLDRLAPFGVGHPEPVLLARGLTLSGTPRIIKERHICLPLAGSVNAMGWSRTGQTAWAERIQPLNLIAGSQIDCVFRLRRTRTRSTAGWSSI